MAPTMATNQPVAAKEDNHISLDTSINNIDDVVDHIERLRNRITKQEAINPEATGKPEPTLANVLANGSIDINDKCTRMHDLLDEIENLLF